MAEEPSIKGSALSSLVEDVLALRSNGRISAAMLELRLEAADLALLETKVAPALWYSIGSYRRLSELLVEVEGRGDPNYLAARGARAAQRLWEGGLYAQLQHGEEKAEAARKKGLGLAERDGRLITTLSAAMFNFTRWAYQQQGGGARIDVTDAEAFPDVCMHSARGFLAYVVSRLRQSETAISAERAGRDRVVFRFRLNR